MDWKTRLKNPLFWSGMISAALMLIQAVLKPFGIVFDITVLEVDLLAIVNCIFAVLVVLGVVVDPTTPGISD